MKGAAAPSGRLAATSRAIGRRKSAGRTRQNGQHILHTASGHTAIGKNLAGLTTTRHSEIYRWVWTEHRNIDNIQTSCYNIHLSGMMCWNKLSVLRLPKSAQKCQIDWNPIKIFVYGSSWSEKKQNLFDCVIKLAANRFRLGILRFFGFCNSIVNA